MATYAPITPASGSFTAVPTAAVDRIGVAHGGALWISDDASPSLANALPLLSGSSFFIAANRQIRVASAAPGAQLRLMDY